MTLASRLEAMIKKQDHLVVRKHHNHAKRLAWLMHLVTLTWRGKTYFQAQRRIIRCRISLDLQFMTEFRAGTMRRIQLMAVSKGN